MFTGIALDTGVEVYQSSGPFTHIRKRTHTHTYIYME